MKSNLMRLQNNLCIKCLVIHQRTKRVELMFFVNIGSEKMMYKIYFLSLLITSTIAISLDETVPKSQDCFENGTYPRGKVVDISYQKSPENCANRCNFLTACIYFTFDPIKQMCESLSDRGNGISTYYCPDCISGYSDHFCGAHGYCLVSCGVHIYVIYQFNKLRAIYCSNIENVLKCFLSFKLD